MTDGFPAVDDHPSIAPRFFQVAGVAACVPPARRARRVDVVPALRSD